MKNISKIFLASILLGSLALTAQAQLFYVTLNSTTGEANADPENFDIGTQFTVGAKDISVTALGAWGGAGTNPGQSPSTQLTLPIDTTAYLWNSSGTKLASVALTAGDPATLASTVVGQGWAFGTLSTPVTLVAGGTYYISNDCATAATSSPGLGYTRLAPSEFTEGTDVTETNLAYYAARGAFPNGNAQANGAFGGNFEYTVVPEPSTWTLLLGGVAACGFLVRRRGAKA